MGQKLTLYRVSWKLPQCCCIQFSHNADFFLQEREQQAIRQSVPVGPSPTKPGMSSPRTARRVPRASTVRTRASPSPLGHVMLVCIQA